MADEEDMPAVVIDNGSGTCKAGFAGDDAPRRVFSAVVGRSRFDTLDEDGESYTQDPFVGSSAQQARDFLSLTYPIERGVVKNWDDAEMIWDFCFRDLRTEPSSQPVFMSEPVLNPTSCQQRMLESMFESFSVPAFFSQNIATLDLCSNSRGIGVVVDIGEGLTQVVPIYYGNLLKHATQRQEFGGKDITLNLSNLLRKHGVSFSTQSELEDVREIKDSFSYVADNFSTQNENMNDMNKTFVDLSDGNRIEMAKELFQCAECIFQPEMLGPNYSHLKPIHKLIQDSIESIGMEIRGDFYTQVFLCGGVTMTQGFCERLRSLLRRDIKSRTNARMVSRVTAAPERKYSAWIGGSMEASLCFMKDFWITKTEYEEFGPSVVYWRSGKRQRTSYYS